MSFTLKRFTTAMSGRPASRSEPHQIVVNDHVEHPVEAVLNAPVSSHRSAEPGG
jgi:hypothetical protein